LRTKQEHYWKVPCWLFLGFIFIT